MKIGLVLPNVPQYSETFFNYKINNLTSAGYEVIVFSNKAGDNSDKYKTKCAYPVNDGNKIRQIFKTILVVVKSFLINYKGTKNLFDIEKASGESFTNALKSIYINAHIITEKPDWLHFGFMTMTLKRENVAKALDIKMSVSFRGYDINIYPLKNPGCYNKAWKNVDKVHSISDYLYNKAIGLGLSRDVPYEKITPAIDLNFFSLKKFPGYVNKKLNILTVGRLNWIKDYETAISSMKILKDYGVDFTYNVVGSGPELERLTFCAYQLDIMDRVIFHGKKEHSEINEMMEQSDIYLQTSMQEGFCGSVLEAQAKGLLCIVSDADGLKENVIDGVSGWIAKRRVPKSFADKINSVMKMPEEERNKVALFARERVKNEYSIEDQKSRFLNFFTK